LGLFSTLVEDGATSENDGDAADAKERNSWAAKQNVDDTVTKDLTMKRLSLSFPIQYLIQLF